MTGHFAGCASTASGGGEEAAGHGLQECPSGNHRTISSARNMNNGRPAHSDRQRLMATTGPAEYGHD